MTTSKNELQAIVEPEEFVSIVGVRFAAWLEEQETDSEC
jgi:hypothetical protein